MKIKKDNIIGFVLGLLPVLMLYFALECQPFAKANQANEQKHSIPAICEAYETSLADIGFVELQFSAVITDMHRYLGWYPDKKDWIKKASIKALYDLKTIKAYLQQLNFKYELAELKDMQLSIIDMLIQIYDGAELKSIDDIKKAFVGFNSFTSQYSGKLEDALKKYESAEKLSKDFDHEKEEVKFAQNQQDKQIYLNAIELIEERRFDQAYKNLTSLREKYKDTVFESCIMLKMSDCLLMIDPNDQNDNIFNPDEGLKLLSDIVDDGEYSPVLFDAFYKWRTETQSLWHGMSNMSEIPNWEYNLKRWQVMQTIRKYLKTNPDDVFAETQSTLLLSLPNISRGGAFGNYNIDDFANLYMEIDSDVND